MITEAQLQAAYAAGDPLAVGFILNSKGCGYRQTGWELLVPGGVNITALGLLTQTGQDNPNIHGWVQEYGRWLKEKNASSVVYNYAGSGWTTADHITRGTVAALAAKTPKPVAVFLQLQVNDRLKDNGAFSGAIGRTWAQFQADQRTIVRDLIAADILPILVKEDNQPMPGGTPDSRAAGWYWGEYHTGMSVPPTSPTGDGLHIAFSHYAAFMDELAQDAEWVNGVTEPLTVLDCYTPTLNTGQEPQYRYLSVTGIPDNSANGLAPADFRASLMHGWNQSYDTGAPMSINDLWHQNDAGGAIILGVHQAFMTAVVEPVLTPLEFIPRILTTQGYRPGRVYLKDAAGLRRVNAEVLT